MSTTFDSFIDDDRIVHIECFGDDPTIEEFEHYLHNDLIRTGFDWDRRRYKSAYTRKKNGAYLYKRHRFKDIQIDNCEYLSAYLTLVKMMPKDD